MGIATTGEQAALQRSVREWASRADLRGPVRAAGPSGPGPDEAPAGAGGIDVGGFWESLAGLGAVAAGLPEEFGGGGRLTDAGVALEAAAQELVPGPLLPTVLAATLLVRHGGPSALVGELAEGRRTGAVAVNGEPLTASPLPDGGLRLDGVVPVLLGAAPGAVLVLRARDEDGERWVVTGAGAAGLTVEAVPAFDLSMPVAAVRLAGVAVPADHVLGGLMTADVRDLAVTLAAAEAAGIAEWTLRTATEYAKVRVQFGRVIGSRQAVKHLCAGMLTRREEAVALAWDAARALDEATPGASLAAAVAGAAALDAAVENAKDCIQVLGGIGFTWEHDAHLYLRRALALRQWLGGGATWRARVADLVAAGSRRPLTVPPASDDVADAEFRAEVRAVLEGLDPENRRTALAGSGYLVPHWPAPYGLGASARQQLTLDGELQRAGITRPDLGIGAWAVPTVVQHGSDTQRERFVWPSLRGEIEWCQLFSEPEAGSDLASLRTRAERADGGWRLTGQKVWTSHARTADWAICLARTDPDAEPHAGITFFLVDMSSPGIDTRPLREITGEALFNEVFLDGVFVPDDLVVGEVDGGWRLARGTLAAERVSMGGSSSLGAETETLLGLKDVAGLGPDRIGAIVARGSAVSLIGLLALVRRLAVESGEAAPPPGPESSVVKLLGTRHRQDVAEAALEVLGEAGLVVGPESARVQHLLLLTRCLTIAGGTTQILLNVAAERLLGLPREK